jgi:hypothetical protein
MHVERSPPSPSVLGHFEAPERLGGAIAVHNPRINPDGL